MDVVLILGAHNSGKSTLVRSLTGLGRGSNSHPSEKNIAKLYWTSNRQYIWTFCLISSLNEGKIYDLRRHRFSESIQPSLSKANTISPRDLRHALDAYEKHPKQPCEQAIMCISTSFDKAGWSAEDYIDGVRNGHLGKHKVSHILVVGDSNSRTTGGPIPNTNSLTNASLLDLRRPSPIRNEVADDARKFIGIL